MTKTTLDRWCIWHQSGRQGAQCVFMYTRLALRALRRSDCAAEETVSLQNDTNRTDARKPSGLDKRWVICTSIHITLLLDCTTLSAALASEALSCYHCSLCNVPSCAIALNAISAQLMKLGWWRGVVTAQVIEGYLIIMTFYNRFILFVTVTLVVTRPVIVCFSGQAKF